MRAMQRTYTTSGGIILSRSNPPRQRFVRSLILAGMIAAALPLAACEAWNQRAPQGPQEAAVYSGPSQTRGRPPAPPASTKTKPKAKKKPAAPATPPADATAPSGSGPQGAAQPGPAGPAPGEAAPSETAPSDTPQGDSSQNGTAPADTGDQPGTGTADSNQTASLPGQTDHLAGSKPDDMIGRDENGIRALIGAPARTRTEGSTTVWSYEKDGCSLDLFLFYDVKTGAQRVLSYEIKPTATDSDAIQACYNKFHSNV